MLQHEDDLESLEHSMKEETTHDPLVTQQINQGDDDDDDDDQNQKNLEESSVIPKLPGEWRVKYYNLVVTPEQQWIDKGTGYISTTLYPIDKNYDISIRGLSQTPNQTNSKSILNDIDGRNDDLELTTTTTTDDDEEEENIIHLYAPKTPKQQNNQTTEHII
mmetsp:Transcript_12598/g.18891  ORF Transcript_12598/g.18891 Transcript_12598/m.18891 type:complete len:162 (-) Transcript_12598:61-546(-)